MEQDERRPYGPLTIRMHVGTTAGLEAWRLCAGFARDQSNAETKTVLHLSPAMVKTHVARILSKLGLRGRLQVVAAAYESGLVEGGTTPA